MNLITLVRIKVWLTRTRLWAGITVCCFFLYPRRNQLTLTYTCSVLPLKSQYPLPVHDILTFRKSSLEVKNNLKLLNCSGLLCLRFWGCFFANTKRIFKLVHIMSVLRDPIPCSQSFYLSVLILEKLNWNIPHVLVLDLILYVSPRKIFLSKSFFLSFGIHSYLLKFFFCSFVLLS